MESFVKSYYILCMNRCKILSLAKLIWIYKTKWWTSNLLISIHAYTCIHGPWSLAEYLYGVGPKIMWKILGQALNPHRLYPPSSNENEWMKGVLGHDSALLRLYWAGDYLGEWDEVCYESCPSRRIDRSTFFGQQSSVLPLYHVRMPPPAVMFIRWNANWYCANGFSGRKSEIVFQYIRVIIVKSVEFAEIPGL